MFGERNFRFDCWATRIYDQRALSRNEPMEVLVSVNGHKLMRENLTRKSVFAQGHSRSAAWQQKDDGKGGMKNPFPSFTLDAKN